MARGTAYDLPEVSGEGAERTQRGHREGATRVGGVAYARLQRADEARRRGAALPGRVFASRLCGDCSEAQGDKLADRESTRRL